MLSTTTASEMFLPLLQPALMGTPHHFRDDQRSVGRHRNGSKGKATPVCSPAQSGRYMRCLRFGCGLTQKTALFFNCIPVNYIAIIRKR